MRPDTVLYHWIVTTQNKQGAMGQSHVWFRPNRGQAPVLGKVIKLPEP